MNARTTAEMLLDEPELLREEPPDLEPTTQTVLARDLRVGDVLVSAALGGIWNARVEAKRIERGEVFLQLAGCLPVCLGAWEVVEVSP